MREVKVYYYVWDNYHARETWVRQTMMLAHVAWFIELCKRDTRWIGPWYYV